ncbi:hypothetical protein CEXT_676221 [Caerostris extrusa]|uniref:Uncharacterized protein n=1 Tax=Caerostris extrusa TaxID=172846 RepID=A0AAV4WQH2_CAEEX|nr:hypothetical protein CEXT_676221 [Caerostris extrusa]
MKEMYRRKDSKLLNLRYGQKYYALGVVSHSLFECVLLLNQLFICLRTVDPVPDFHAKTLHQLFVLLHQAVCLPTMDQTPCTSDLHQLVCPPSTMAAFKLYHGQTPCRSSNRNSRPAN